MGDALAISGLRVQRAGREVLHGIDFRAEEGHVAAILGPNGAGKTTLLKAIAGLLPYSGEVRLFGEPLQRLSAQARAKALAFVPQASLLRSGLRVHQVVMQGRYPHMGNFARPSREDLDAVARAMATVDLARFADRPFTGLSFGEQRRVLLARGMATGARLLCLDEPTASLDIAHALALFSLLRRLAASGRCVLMVLHQLDDALTHTDRSLLLHDGHCHAQGPTPEVIVPDTIRSVYGVQMRERAGLRFIAGEADPWR